ncbi:nucleotidyltransferase family protein [Myceligenerans salitolerans]|uniref:NTP transferase domain-containing protein n=1 Tax=Myceligenerans salitolerans TaxID=1230528 RepID=A0ABS3I4Z9_9MICO|nr:NTP transferase domain-containing protein [Myceligenerans salitolerans]MBO0608048.1 NTP transferase domain-containing protein [Myceligenerans salitolerans]
MVRAVGIVLAAGAGSRFGGPKALARAEDGTPWVEIACRTLLDGGCQDVVVTLGAGADEAGPLVPGWAGTAVVPDWVDGASASLRAGLAAAAGTSADVAVITLVDLPDLPSAAVRRMLGPDGGVLGAGTLRRAVHDGRPGHPVVVGRRHWEAIAAAVTGDKGAADYLRAHAATVVDCTDLGGGQDVDRRDRGR